MELVDTLDLGSSALTSVGVRVPPFVLFLPKHPVYLLIEFIHTSGEYVKISVKDLTTVDKEVTIKTTREYLQPKFDKAFKKYQSQISMPGFRPGRVPLGIIRKRFSNDIEKEEINKYVQKIFEEDIVENHNPVGEAKMLDLQWENDELEVVFKIGVKPEFELIDITKVKVNKMVHDVTEEDVQEEVDRSLERDGNWEDVTSEIDENSKVMADVECA